MFYRTLACLPALTGAWAERGGGIAKSVGSYSDGLVDGLALMRPDLERAGGRHEPRTLNMSRLGEILTTPHAGEASGPGVHALINWNCNPLVTVPQAELIRPGMERDDLFTVVHEQFLTDTARYADIVLPAATQIESDDVVLPWGHLWIGWNAAAIDPPGEACSNTELFRRLGRAMGYTEPSLFDDDDTLLRAALPTIDLDELRRVGWVRAPYPDDGRPFGDGEFDTPSGRVHLASDQLERMGQPRVPVYVAPREGPDGDAELLDRYPLQLLTPKHHTRFLNSGYADLPKHGPAEGGPFVELVAADAARPRARRRADRPGLERPGLGRGAGEDHRAAAPRRGRDPVRMVEPPSPRRPHRQQPHQRHAHRVGRRRRLLRHTRPGRSTLSGTSGVRHQMYHRGPTGCSVTCGHGR